MSKNEFICDCNIVHKNIVNQTKSKMLCDDEFLEMSNFFGALGTSTRIKIVWALFQNEMCVCDLCNLLSMRKSAISHQLNVLRCNKMIKCRRDGKIVYYSLLDNHIANFIKNAKEHIKY